MVLYHPDSECYEARARPRAGAEDIRSNKSAFNGPIAVSHSGLVTNPKILLILGKDSDQLLWSTRRCSARSSNGSRFPPGKLSITLPQSLTLPWTTDAHAVARGYDGIWTAIAVYLRENGRTALTQHHEGDGHDI